VGVRRRRILTPGGKEKRKLETTDRPFKTNVSPVHSRCAVTHSTFIPPLRRELPSTGNLCYCEGRHGSLAGRTRLRKTLNLTVHGHETNGLKKKK